MNDSPDEEDEDDSKEDQLFNGAAQTQMLTLTGAGDPALTLDKQNRLLPFLDSPEKKFKFLFKIIYIS